MIDPKDIDFLTAYIDLRKSIQEGDLTKAKAVCKKLNNMELSEEDQTAVNDCVGFNGALEDISQQVVRFFINNLNCIVNSEQRTLELDAMNVLSRQDKDEMKLFLKEHVKSGMFEGEFNHLLYARALLAMCYATKQFDKMDEIRGLLEAK